MRCENRCDTRRAKARICLRGGALAAVLAVGACASPPSVTPLLRVAEAAVREEAAFLRADVARDRAQVNAARQSLAVAYDADLAQRESLSAEWVRDATSAYVAARETLLRHELALEAERRARAANLDAAADAARRAAELLEQQDALILRTTGGVDLWRLLRTEPQETQP